MKDKSLFVVCFFVFALILAFAVSPFASSAPDGLERVAMNHDFMEKAIESSRALIKDYEFPKVEGPALSTSLAGLIGTLLVFGVTFVFLKFLVAKDRNGERC